MLASVYLDQKRLEPAEAAIKDAIAVTAKLHGENSAELLQPYQILGRLRREQGREGASLAAYDRALALAAPDSPGATETRRLRAFALQHFKRWDAASTEISAVIALMRVSELADARDLLQALIVQCELADVREDKPLARAAREALREMKTPDVPLQAAWQARYDVVLKAR